MENSSKETSSQRATRKQTSRAASKKTARKGASAGSNDGQAPNQLMKHGRSLVTKAEKWAGGAARLASPLADASANAVVMGILGMGVGIAIGAMLPRMNVSDMLSSATTGRDIGPGKAGAQRRKSRRR